MRINNSKVSFTSKINFVSREEFDNLPLEELEKNGNCAGYNKRGFDEKLESSVVGEKAYTYGVYGCSAGTIIGTKMLMFHLNPVTYESIPMSVERGLNKYLVEINEDNKCKKLKGIIVGGQFASDRSRSLFENLKTAFAKLNVNASIIWGQACGKTRMYYSLDNDTYLINAKDYHGNDILNANDLDDNFETVKISKNDKLYINNKEIKRL